MEKQLHTCVGFYPNGQAVVNIVRDQDLEGNIKYNAEFRPGRFYFVDGEYACGGLLVHDAQTAFIEQCKARIAEMDLPEPVTDSRPYE